MKKITNKTRVKVLANKIHTYLELNIWQFDRYSEVYKYMYDNFHMKITSKRLGIYYFNIGDKTKYSIFLLKHSDLLY